MRKQALIAAFGLTAGLATAAFAQPSQDQPPPGYGGPPPGAMSGPPGGAMSGPGGAPHGARGRFEAANVTHDGRLTLQQAQAAGWHAVAKHFGEIDRDNKGYITMQDLHAWKSERHAERTGGTQGPPPGAGMQGPPPGSMQGPPPGGGMQAPPPSMQGPPPGSMQGPPPGQQY
jgi:hypothetical protein